MLDVVADFVTAGPGSMLSKITKKSETKLRLAKEKDGCALD
jgi:hypothetical protein